MRVGNLLILALLKRTRVRWPSAGPALRGPKEGRCAGRAAAKWACPQLHPPYAPAAMRSWLSLRQSDVPDATRAWPKPYWFYAPDAVPAKPVRHAPDGAR